MVKLLKSNYLLVKDKLEANLNVQKTFFQTRLEKFDLLNRHANEARQDPILHPILFKDIGQLNDNEAFY